MIPEITTEADKLMASLGEEPVSDILPQTTPLSAGPKKKKFPVVEFFGPTIQGEGSSVGMPTYFLRLGGCDYRCSMCDSLHAVLPDQIKKHATLMTAEEIFAMIQEKPRLTDSITISGGNPCLWNIEELVEMLQCAGWNILVETQATLWQDWLRYCDVTVSPKGPGMGEVFEYQKFLGFMNKCYQFDIRPTIKVVVFEQRDIELMAELLAEFPTLTEKAYFSIGNRNPPDPNGAVRMSQEAFVNQVLKDFRDITADILNDPRLVIRNVRILPQLHTLIWGNAQGH